MTVLHLFSVGAAEVAAPTRRALSVATPAMPCENCGNSDPTEGHAVCLDCLPDYA